MKWAAAWCVAVATFIALEFWLVQPVGNGCGGVPVIAATAGYSNSGTVVDQGDEGGCVNQARHQLAQGAIFAGPFAVVGAALTLSVVADSRPRRRPFPPPTGPPPGRRRRPAPDRRD